MKRVQAGFLVAFCLGIALMLGQLQGFGDAALTKRVQVVTQARERTIQAAVKILPVLMFAAC